MSFLLNIILCACTHILYIPATDTVEVGLRHFNSVTTNDSDGQQKLELLK